MAYNYISYENLERYDGKIKALISAEDAKAYKTIIADTTAKKVYFYKKENAVAGTDTPDAVVDQAFIPLIDTATGGKLVESTVNGTLQETDFSVSGIESEIDALESSIGSINTDLASIHSDITSINSDIASINSDISSIHSDISSINTDLTSIHSDISSISGDLASLASYVGSIPSDATSNDVVGYIDEAIDATIESLDSSATIVTRDATTGNLKIVDSVLQNNGKIQASTVTHDLAAVAETGAAEDVALSSAYTDLAGSTASDVENAIAAIGTDIATLASQSAGGVASKTVWFRDSSAGQSEYAKVYNLYQGANAPESETEPAALIGTINMPKDKVLQDADIVDITYSEGHLYDGLTDVTELIKGEGGTATADDAGKYMKFIMQNVADPLYANLSEFIDIYTVEPNATQIQLAIDAHNQISATIVAGSIGSTELASSAVTTVKIADGNVTLVKLESSIQANLSLASTAVQPSDFTPVTDQDIDDLFS